MHDIDQKKFGERLKDSIKLANTTQKDLADKIGITKTAMNNYVGGRIPDATILYKICKTINVSMDWLLTGSESESKVNYENISLNKNLIELNEKELNVINMYRKLSETDKIKIEGFLEINAAKEESSATLAESYTYQNGGGSKNIG